MARAVREGGRGVMHWLRMVAARAAVAGVAAVHAPELTDVFVGGAGGHAVYRIPAALRLRDGTVLAFAEARGSQADNGANDIVLRASRDDGSTWGAQRTVLDEPGRSLNNPCAVEVAAGPHVGRVLLMFQSYPTGKGEAQVAPGIEGPGTCRTLLMHSDDGGGTWSPARDVTAGVKGPPPVTSTATGPGVGIQLSRGTHRGRIVMPFNQGPTDAWRVYAALTDDGGDTWRMGALAPEDPTGRGVANEVQVAERADGSVLLVARQFRGAGRRKVAVSQDGAETWTALADSGELPDPSCMGGLAAIPAPGTPLVFTGPNSRSARNAGCAWFSWDGGSTWPRKAAIHAGSFAYSVPVPLGPDRIGVLFERDGCSRISWATVAVPKPPGREAGPQPAGSGTPASPARP